MLLASPEVAGFARTGGLADAAAALPVALQELGHECAVILPKYACTRKADAEIEPTELTFTIPIQNRKVGGRLSRSKLPGTEIPVYLVEQQQYFDRDHAPSGRGLYQFTDPNGTETDYPDNCERFVFFSRAILEAIRHFDYWPDILHVQDWQTGLVPVYLREEYAKHEDESLRERYRRIRTLFTFHNVGYQGLFWHWDMMLAGLDWSLYNHHALEFHGQMSLLKAGLVFGDALSTISPSYAQQIRTPETGCGLEGVLEARSEKLYGIINGIDGEWNPETDPQLSANYTAENALEAKPKCKADLQQQLGLARDAAAPLLAFVGDFTEANGIDLLVESVAPLVSEGCQFAIHGMGGGEIVVRLGEIANAHPRSVMLDLDGDDALRHRLFAGADALLMPSRFEPAGSNQLIAMRYGTPPIVRNTGGLADTVVDANPSTFVSDEATGFTFDPPQTGALADTVRRAIHIYREQPKNWSQIVRGAMRQDWSWHRTAQEYQRLFDALMELPIQ